MSYTQDELALLIANFMNKHGRDRKMLTIGDYEFEIDGFDNIDISPKSINVLPNESIQFNGSATVHQHDIASKVHSRAPIIFNGVAFFAKYADGDNNLFHVSIDRIIINPSHETIRH